MPVPLQAGTAFSHLASAFLSRPVSCQLPAHHTQHSSPTFNQTSCHLPKARCCVSPVRPCRSPSVILLACLVNSILVQANLRSEALPHLPGTAAHLCSGPTWSLFRPSVMVLTTLQDVDVRKGEGAPKYKGWLPHTHHSDRHFV